MDIKQYGQRDCKSVYVLTLGRDIILLMDAVIMNSKTGHSGVARSCLWPLSMNTDEQLDVQI